MFASEVVGVSGGTAPQGARLAAALAASTRVHDASDAFSTKPWSARSSAARWREWLTPVVDVAVVATVFAVEGGIARPEIALACVLFLVGLAATGAWSPRYLRHAAAEAARVAVAWLVAASAVAVFCALTEQPQHLASALLGVGAAGLGVVAGRCGTKAIRTLTSRRGHGVERVVVVGEFERAATIAAALERPTSGAARVVSLVCPDEGKRLPASVGVARVVHGGLEAAVQAALLQHAGRVVVADGAGIPAQDVAELAWQLGRTAHGVRVDLAPALDGVSSSRLRLVSEPGTPMLGVAVPASPTGPRAGLKRCLDLVLTLPAMLVLAPVLGVLALMVRLDSPGAVLFKQVRVGRDGVPFTMFKFRTMHQNAEQMLLELAEENEAEGPLFKLAKDPRVTRVGRLLRSTSLDELPQLLNVLHGTMSLVGPRPALPSEVADYSPTARKRLRVKPGLTGPWQVGGRSDLGWEEGLRLDLGYVENWSVAGDLVLLARTVRAVVTRRGAY